MLKRRRKTHRTINISEFILGAVVKKSDATTVKHNEFEHQPSKTHNETTL